MTLPPCDVESPNRITPSPLLFFILNLSRKIDNFDVVPLVLQSIPNLISLIGPYPDPSVHDRVNLAAQSTLSHRGAKG
jgi:hypothetical protein